MEMEAELEPRVKPLPFKIKATSRESPSQKACHVTDPDLRSYWSTSTNTKEWILLELDEACLLSHIRIYNKSVLEWEISAGLRYKPEAFVKVRPRCEAPRRDMMYPMNYTPCKFVRISCLRGNPIAIFFIQLIGVSVPGLEPELQPVVNYFLPHIISHKQDAQDSHLQLLQDISSKLGPFLPNLEVLQNLLRIEPLICHFPLDLRHPRWPLSIESAGQTASSGLRAPMHFKTTNLDLHRKQLPMKDAPTVVPPQTAWNLTPLTHMLTLKSPTDLPTQLSRPWHATVHKISKPGMQTLSGALAWPVNRVHQKHKIISPIKTYHTPVLATHAT